MDRVFAFIFVVIMGASAPLLAQDTEQADKTFLENWLQETLSDAGRNVTVTGFAGALSSNATLDTLTIADDDGVWFTMRDVSLQWSRAALVSGRLDVTELTASEIIVERLPKSEDGIDTEDAQASQFALPDLPVSVEIELIRAETIKLGPDILGEAATLSLEGSLLLADGDGNANLEVARKDRADRLSFEGAFSNATRILSIDLDFDEAQDGLVSTLLRIPDAPALRLQVAGEAPLSDFTARMALNSDGQPRFGGTIRIAALQSESAQGYAFSADLDGDVRPLFSQELQPFFGESAQLALQGESRPGGELILERLQIMSSALEVEGSLVLATSGWPERFDLQGRIIGEGDIRLPLAGPATTLRSAEISAKFDAAQGDVWQADARIAGLVRDDLRLERAHLAGTGQITRAPVQSLSAEITFETSQLKLGDNGLSRAIGPAPEGSASLVWQSDQPLVFNALRLESGDLQLQARGQIESLENGFPITGRATIRSADLSRFAPLAGRPLEGATTAKVEGGGTLLGGAFDIELQAETTDLRVGEPRVDPLLTGKGKLLLDVQRDTSGTMLDALEIETQSLTSMANGRLDADEGRLDLSARLGDIALIEPKLSGPASVDTAMNWQSGGALNITRLEVSAATAVLSATGAVYPEGPNLPANGKLSLIAGDLSRLSDLLGRSLAGQLELSLDGSGQILGQKLDLEALAVGQGLRTGSAQIDRVVAGALDAEVSIAIGDAQPDIRFVRLETPRLSVDAKGNGPATPIALSARLADLAVFVPGFGGAVSTEGTVTVSDRFGRQLRVALNATGPGGASARIAGDIRDYGASLSLETSGNAPIGLANPFISPRSLDGLANFDLLVSGPPQLSSLSGTVNLTNGRLSLPKLSTALSQLAGSLRLGGQRLEANITGTAGTGGSFRLQGPISLAAPFNANLVAMLMELGISDPNLYRTTLNGRVAVTGPLTGGAAISGRLDLGRTELRVPSGGGTTPGAVANIRHINEPAAVRETRRRAGLIGQAKQAMTAFPLNLTINAPNRIFVRGRGLDAELGGQLRLGGTTADVTASGLFELIRGRLDILGRRLVLTQGLIDLRGALDPYIRFVAETESEDIIVRVILEGLASSPSVTFQSEPDLPQEEAVARLLFGRGLDQISPFQAAQIISAAATLSGNGSGGLTGGLRRAFSLSDFDVTTTDEGATQVRAGAYISEKIYSEVTADSDGNQEIDLKLDLSPTVTVKGSTSTTGNTGIGVFFEKDY